MVGSTDLLHEEQSSKHSLPISDTQHVRLIASQRSWQWIKLSVRLPDFNNCKQHKGHVVDYSGCAQDASTAARNSSARRRRAAPPAGSAGRATEALGLHAQP